MADIPAPLQYAKIVAYFGAVLPDADLGDSPPDMGSITGTVKIEPNITPKIARATGTTPPRIITLPSYTCTIQATGEMYGPDNEPGVNVLASNSLGMSPTFQYKATINLSGVAPADQPAPILFFANAGTTTNLTNIVSVAQPGVVTVVSDESRIAAEAAAASVKRGVAGGVAALDSSGLVTNADGSYPAGGGTGGTVVDATTTVKGKIKLAGDLGGTADLPTVTGMLRLANLPQSVQGAITFNQAITVGTPTLNGHAATKGYVDSLGTGAVPDASDTIKGKIQLTGDLAGIAGAPTVPNMVRITNVDQNVDGIKTFLKSPVVPVATLATQVPQKKYVDDQILLLPTLAGNNAFTGNSTVPTQTVGNNTTRIANTAFVAAALAGYAALPALAGVTMLGLIRTGGDVNFTRPSVVPGVSYNWLHPSNTPPAQMNVAAGDYWTSAYTV